jgi:hypothetical protein
MVRNAHRGLFKMETNVLHHQVLHLQQPQQHAVVPTTLSYMVYVMREKKQFQLQMEAVRQVLLFCLKVGV